MPTSVPVAGSGLADTFSQPIRTYHLPTKRFSFSVFGVPSKGRCSDSRTLPRDGILTLSIYYRLSERSLKTIEFHRCAVLNRETQASRRLAPTEKSLKCEIDAP